MSGVEDKIRQRAYQLWEQSGKTFCRLPKFGRLSALAITMGRFPASSILLRRVRSRSAVSRSLALATFSAATPKQTPPANRMETNNENRLRHSPAPMKCGAWRPMEQRSISGFRPSVREVKDRPNAEWTRPNYFCRSSTRCQEPKDRPGVGMQGGP